jgi:hypothetical protein
VLLARCGLIRALDAYLSSDTIMERIITNNVWTQVTRLLKKRENRIAAIAYVSKGTPLSFGDGDVLVCDASDAAIKSGETDAITLKKFLNGGAELYSCPNLHAKILISGNSVVIGSANLSTSSEHYLLEASLISTRSQIRSQVSALIHNIVKVSIRIDDAFISHIISLPVTKRFRPFASRRKPKVKEIGNRYWIVNTRPLDNYPEYEEEYVEQGEEEARNVLKDSEADVNWIRLTGNGRFRRLAKPGDTVVEITKYKRKATVSAPRSILVRQHHKKWTRFYLGEPDVEMSWTNFEADLKKVGLRKIKKTSVRELSQRDVLLMESIW